MGLQNSAGKEIVPGYCLVERVGTGGYGEVWKATAPGGLMKAIKIVFGQIGDTWAEQELKALRRIKEVRHPFLVSLERFEIRNGQLVIVMELADASLVDRYRECRAAGLRGVPRDELLGYLRDAADALDFMNETHGLQHLDIKPQNLLLVGKRIKVADFGLVKELQSTRATATGGGTPVYATPEAFDGKISRFSDQYSLAIVYEEMLTGVRPFAGTTAYQLAVQHSTCPPLLDPLPASDRAAVGRALAKVPEQRFPRCVDLVEQLVRAPQSSTISLRSAEAEETGFVPGLVAAPWPGGTSQSPPAPASDSFLKLPTKWHHEPGQSEPTVVPPIAEPSGLVAASDGRAPFRPTLFLGIGGLAGMTLRHLRQRLSTRLAAGKSPPPFRFLLLDTDRDHLRSVRQGSAEEALTHEETLLLPLHRPSHYRNRTRELLRWLDRRWLYGIPNSLKTEGLRPHGRLALVDNAAEVLNRLRQELTALNSFGSADGRNPSADSEPSAEPQVYVVASISGGTGSAMLPALADAVRHLLAEFHISSGSLAAVLLHATPPKPAEAELARVNAYATLDDIFHPDLASGAPAHAEAGGLNACGAERSLFGECYLVPLGEQLNEDTVGAATASVADYFYLRAVIQGGMLAKSTHRDGPGMVRTFGLARIYFPKQRLVQLTVDRLCRRLVDNWRGVSEETLQEQPERTVAAEVAALGLEPETLAAQCQAALEAVLGDEPEACFRKLFAGSPLSQAMPDSQTWSTLAEQFLAQVDELIGPGREQSEEPNSVTTLAEVALRGLREKRCAAATTAVKGWFLGLFEDSAGRLPAAQRSARGLGQYLATTIEQIVTQLTQARAYRTRLRGRLAGGELSSKGSGVFWSPLGRRPMPGDEAASKILEYCSLRLLELSLEYGEQVLCAVSRQVAGVLGELADCQQHLGLLARMFADGSASVSEASRVTAESGRMKVLPGRAQTVGEAADELLSKLPPQFFGQLDRTLQSAALERVGGLWGLLTGRGKPLTALCEELRDRATDALAQVLQELDAAQLFLDTRPSAAEVQQALAAQFHAAAPRLEVTEPQESFTVAVPSSPAGETIRDLVVGAVSPSPVTTVASEGDVVLCRELTNLSLVAAASGMLGSLSVYADHARVVMTPVVVDWNQFQLTTRRCQPGTGTSAALAQASG
jgi:serine/threonine protein kinase